MHPRTANPGSLGSFLCLRDIPRTGRVTGSDSRCEGILHLAASVARFDCKGITAGTVGAACFLTTFGRLFAPATGFRISIVGVLPSQIQTGTGAIGEVGFTIQCSLGAFLSSTT